MSQRPIMDAGPGLNFFSLNKERLLFATLGPLAVPEIVEHEIVRKARQDQRFKPAERVLGKVPPRLLEVLSDDVTPELATAVNRIAGVPIESRMRSSKDLGETMVVAHAVVAAERGDRVIVLIDDGGGRRVAAREAARLRRLRERQADIGSIALISTGHVLKKAAGGEDLPDRNSMRELYERLRALDDGLAPLEGTRLMELPCWS
ncbi:hypothetical protein VVR84_14995 [Kocuria carniphila]|uniref:PIN domain-containing protein n=1 Tax=Kocuria carniphila TaxID=262208 RepID=A0ABV3V5J1_9MICC